MSFEFAVVIKTTIVLACAGLTAALLKSASSSTRHAIWAIALFCALLLPVASPLLPVFVVPVLPVAEISAPAPARSEWIGSHEAVSQPVRPRIRPETPVSGRPENVAPSRAMTLQGAITAVWFIGFFICLLRLVRATRLVRRLAKDSEILLDSDWHALLQRLKTELNISGNVELRVAGEMPPMTWGVLCHVVLFPESAKEWADGRRRVVLAHELAHVKRRDSVLQVLVQIICSVYWFSPMVWYAAHRLRVERERACDDQVLNIGERADDYADHLLQIAKGTPRTPSFATVSMAEPSQLETRLISILNSRARRHRLSRTAAAGLLAVIGVFSASIAAVQVTALAAMALPSFETPLSAAPWLALMRPTAIQEPVADGATVSGVVYRGESSEGLPRTRVILSPDGGESPITVATDDRGRFSFQNVPPGKYHLLATREGFARAYYGQRSLNGAGASIALNAKQTLGDIALHMTPTGAISGRIRNRIGDPAANVAVRAQKFEYQNGRRVLTLVQTVRTNDLGEYRLYYLDPGQYVVSAAPFTGPRVLGESTADVEILPGSPFMGVGATTTGGSRVFTALRGLTAQGFATTADTGETYLPIFFPGVVDSAAATPVRVIPGATFEAVDFSVSEVRAVRIRGRLTTPTGQPVQNAAVVLLSRGVETTGVPADHYGTVSPTGEFDFRGMAPGSYELVASTGTMPRGIPSIPEETAGGSFLSREAARITAAPNNAAQRLAARMPIEAGKSDIEDIVLPLQSGYSIPGKISVEGKSAAESVALTAGLLVFLQPDPPDIVPDNHPTLRVRTESAPATVGPDGTFTLASAFDGVYQIGIFNAAKLPQDAYVKSVRIGELDALNPRLILQGTPRSAMEILIGAGSGSADVTVVDEKQAAASAVSVVLIPDSARRQHFDLYAYALTDGNGHARLDHIPAGEYTAFALEHVQPGAWWDPDFVKPYEGFGKPIRITDGSKNTLDLKSIPQR